MSIKFKKRTRTDAIVIHCSASQNKPSIDRATIAQWHRSRGFMDIGYHFVIKTEGDVEVGRDIDVVGSHVQGHNSSTIGICMVGGVDEANRPTNNFTPEQMNSLRKLVTELKLQYPEAEVKGHRDFPNVNKECPCFDVKQWYLSKETPRVSSIVVRKGDTLWGLANKHGVSVDDIKKLNKLVSENIKIGEFLKIPPKV